MIIRRYDFFAWAIGFSIFVVSPANGQTNILKAKTNLAPLHYTNAPSEIPNYLPGKNWGTQGRAIQQMQVPLSPAESARHYVVSPEFDVYLWAAEPDIVKPICMAWDVHARLWIAETLDYPNELRPQGEGRDQIKICQDTDGDGKADRFTVFADKLSIPTGMCFANGGLIVIEGGHTLFLKDTNGDDRADERRVLFSGWNMGDTHATASNLRYGLDNWIWGIVGYSGFDGEVGGKRVRFSMGVFRFKPDGSALEFIRSSNNNTWGLGLSEEGIVFGSTANNNASWYMPIPNRYYESVRGWSASRMETIADSQAFYPITSHVRQVDAHGRYTAGAGHALYTARNYPVEYWNQIAFVAEPTGHLIGMFRMEPNGSDFVARNLGSFIASSDEWAAPIAAEVGPDGQIWFLDWYNYIVQHNPTPAGFTNGKGNAYQTPLRDKRHGRIYRVQWSAAKLTSYPNMLKPTSASLVALLKNDNQLWRMHAQRLLVEQHDSEIIPDLVDIISGKKLDATGLSVGAIHALWTLAGFGDDAIRSVRTDIENALTHPSPGVRRNALAILPRDESSLNAILSHQLFYDKDAQVRLAAFLALSEMPALDKAGSGIHSALKSDLNATDRWLPHAATIAAARHAKGFLQAVMQERSNLSEVHANAAKLIAAHWMETASAADLLPFVLTLKGSSASVATSILDGFLTSRAPVKPADFSAADNTALANLMADLPASAHWHLFALAQKWDHASVFAAQRSQIAATLKDQFGNTSISDAERSDAANRLIKLDDQSDQVSALLSAINPQTSPALVAGIINALGESRRLEVAHSLIGVMGKLTPNGRRLAVAQCLRKKEWAQALLNAVESKQLQIGDLSKEHWSQLRSYSDTAIRERALRLENKQGQASNTDAQAALDRLLPLTESKGDVAKGKQLFATQCAVCHMLGKQGGKVGPDLTGIGQRSKKDLLVEIIDPNRSVEANYRAWTITTKSGDIFTGRLDAETAASVEIYDTTGQKHVVQRRDIEQMNASTLSLMPFGFDQLPREDLAGLLEYLAQEAH